MTRQDIEKLIGGYATGTLTPEEEQALFVAALEDQQLFDALVREQPLRDVLQDPASRASLLATLTEERVPWYRRFARPLVAAAALLCVAVPLALRQLSHPKPQPVLTAEVAGPVRAREAQPVAPAPPPERLTVRVGPKASAKPVARQAESKPEPPSAPQAVAGNAIGSLDATTGAVTPSAKDAMVKANPAGGGGGGSTQPAEVTAQSLRQVPISPSNGFLPSQAPRSMRANLGAATVMMSEKAALARLKCTVLRRQPDGEFVAADPANLQAGDTVKLRLEAEEAGYVHVADGQKLISSPIEPGKPFETTIEPRGAGTRDVDFWFTPGPIVSRVANGAAAIDAPHPPSATHVTLTYK